LGTGSGTIGSLGCSGCSVADAYESPSVSESAFCGESNAAVAPTHASVALSRAPWTAFEIAASLAAVGGCGVMDVPAADTRASTTITGPLLSSSSAAVTTCADSRDRDVWSGVNSTVVEAPFVFSAAAAFTGSAGGRSRLAARGGSDPDFEVSSDVEGTSALFVVAGGSTVCALASALEAQMPMMRCGRGD
jgi:hypothetical protein